MQHDKDTLKNTAGISRTLTICYMDIKLCWLRGLKQQAHCETEICSVEWMIVPSPNWHVFQKSLIQNVLVSFFMKHPNIKQWPAEVIVHLKMSVFVGKCYMNVPDYDSMLATVLRHSIIVAAFLCKYFNKVFLFCVHYISEVGVSD